MKITPGTLFVLDKTSILVYDVENDQVRFIEYSDDNPEERVYRFWSMALLKARLEQELV
jgi:hypothetical protein